MVDLLLSGEKLLSPRESAAINAKHLYSQQSLGLLGTGAGDDGRGNAGGGQHLCSTPGQANPTNCSYALVAAKPSMVLHCGLTVLFH